MAERLFAFIVLAAVFSFGVVGGFTLCAIMTVGKRYDEDTDAGPCPSCPAYRERHLGTDYPRR
jgi:hypothetical protein